MTFDFENPFNDFFQLSFIHNHEQVVSAVINEHYEVGILGSNRLERLIHSQHLNPNHIKIINSLSSAHFPLTRSTPFYPNWTFSATTSIDSKLADSVTSYLNAQIAAGAQAVMIFDTWGGALSPAAYKEFSLSYMQKIVSGLTREADGRAVPVVLFTKGGAQWLEPMAATGCDALGLDWTINISEAERRVGGKVALQGNMDPCVLYSTPEKIRETVKTILDDFGGDTGHVFNLGHGIHQHIDPDNVKVLVDAVHEFSSTNT